jgi:hypothetical protein
MMVQLTPSKWHVAEQYRAIWEQRMGAVDRIRLQKEIDLDTREAPAILSHNRHVAKIPTANLSERRARLNWSPVDPDSRSWLSGAPALGNWEWGEAKKKNGEQGALTGALHEPLLPGHLPPLIAPSHPVRHL